MASNHSIASQLEKGLETCPSIPDHSCTDSNLASSGGVPLCIRCMFKSSMSFHDLTIFSYVRAYGIDSTSQVDGPAMHSKEWPKLASPRTYGIHKGTKTWVGWTPKVCLWCNWLIRLVQDYPIGFPKLSCFLDSDDAFMVYRKFGCVFSRLLLCKQDEIGRIEATLQAMDRTDADDNNRQFLMSYKLDEDRDTIPSAWPASRTQLMEKLEKKALDYGKS